MFYGVLGVVIGGRLGYVLFYKPGYYAAHPLEIVMVWRGGMAFHGGLIGVTLAAYGVKLVRATLEQVLGGLMRRYQARVPDVSAIAAAMGAAARIDPTRVKVDVEGLELERRSQDGLGRIETLFSFVSAAAESGQ